jgi:hypothetical protein
MGLFVVIKNNCNLGDTIDNMKFGEPHYNLFIAYNSDVFTDWIEMCGRLWSEEPCSKVWMFQILYFIYPLKP